ncbi:unnamed protein product [Cuscuta epithymum]|uniref:Uncharacterized protein n=1 Tax=Cuscuta epithymum TaxID=186058 RepID=A0AAV0EZ66_9ASTE|nr:unnamed protein product [Cuscuta epithymum]
MKSSATGHCPIVPIVAGDAKSAAVAVMTSEIFSSSKEYPIPTYSVAEPARGYWRGTYRERKGLRQDGQLATTLDFRSPARSAVARGNAEEAATL